MSTMEPMATSLAPVNLMCVRVAVDLKLFDLIVEHAHPTVTATQLAKATGAEELLIVRLMRVLLQIGYASEHGVNTYGTTPVTLEMTKPYAKACVILYWNQVIPYLAKMPEYLKEAGYKCPTNNKNGPVHFAAGLETDKTIWDLWAATPGTMESFNTFMSGVQVQKGTWIDWFPVQERLLEGGKGNKGDVVMVDVGGGRGHQLAEVKKKFPRTGGRFILQDQPSVIADVRELDESIERMGIDMFESQPITGARVYYFRFIFHDWPDEACRKILRNTAAAMEKGYSKLVIGDYIFPETGVPLMAAEVDVMMMVVHCSIERTERQWRELLDSVGLEVVGVWPSPNHGDGIIEAMLKA